MDVSELKHNNVLMDFIFYSNYSFFTKRSQNNMLKVGKAWSLLKNWLAQGLEKENHKMSLDNLLMP